VTRLDARATFATTRWGLVRAAGGQDPAGRAALGELCARYGYPLYAYLRRGGHAREEADDLVQGFFASLIEREELGELAVEGGRFRSWLVAALRHFVAHERERARAWKRGGRARIVSLDAEEAEQRYAREPADPRSPETFFERKWALAVLERALAELAAEQAAKGRADVLARLWPFLVASEEGATLAEAAQELALSPEAARVAVHRLRRRLRELVLAEISETVARPAEVEDELARLFRAVAQDPRESR
jgi:RNA polymerase sigma-70 factor (ECF subfamily)